MQFECTKVIHNCVAGIVAALKTYTRRCAICQIVHDTAFTFITPVCTNYNDRRHFQFS